MANMELTKAYKFRIYPDAKRAVKREIGTEKNLVKV